MSACGYGWEKERERARARRIGGVGGRWDHTERRLFVDAKCYNCAVVFEGSQAQGKRSAAPAGLIRVLCAAAVVLCMATTACMQRLHRRTQRGDLGFVSADLRSRALVVLETELWRRQGEGRERADERGRDCV